MFHILNISVKVIKRLVAMIEINVIVRTDVSVSKIFQGNSWNFFWGNVECIYRSALTVDRAPTLVNGDYLWQLWQLRVILGLHLIMLSTWLRDVEALRPWGFKPFNFKVRWAKPLTPLVSRRQTECRLSIRPLMICMAWHINSISKKRICLKKRFFARILTLHPNLPHFS